MPKEELLDAWKYCKKHKIHFSQLVQRSIKIYIQINQGDQNQ